MTNVRKLLCILIAMTCVTFALPSVAGNDKKQYSLVMQESSDQTSAPFTVMATVTNEGNSTINSFRLSVTGLMVVSVDRPATGHASFDNSSAPIATVSVTNMHPLKSGDALTVTIHVTSCGDFPWSATVWTGSSLNGQTFDLVANKSNLMSSTACGSSAGGPFTVPDSFNSCGVFNGQRGIYDKDGGTPTGVPYFVTNLVNLPNNGQLHFRWPTVFTDIGGNGLGGTFDPAAAFQYSVCVVGQYKPQPGATQVAWLNTDGTPTSTPGNPAYIQAQTCIPPDVSPDIHGRLPAPYGTLTADLKANDATISIDTTTPSGTIPYPTGTNFDVVIGTERITVNVQQVTVCVDNDGDAGTDSNDCTESDPDNTTTVTTWNVLDRNVGGTASPPLPGTWTASPTRLVMTTPLPILPDPLPVGTPANTPYKAGFQAQMCIVQQQSNNPMTGDHTTTFIDIGDGWASDD